MKTGIDSASLHQTLFTCAGKNAPPLRMTLSFDVLREYWRNDLLQREHPLQAEWRRQFDLVEQCRELHGAIESFDVVERNRPLVDFLMSGVVAPGAWERHLIAAVTPDDMRPLYTTRDFDKYIKLREDEINFTMNFDPGQMLLARMVHMYVAILGQIYGIGLNYEFPVVFVVSDPDTGMERHYKIMIDARFLRIIERGPRVELSDDDLTELRSNMTDLDTWMRILPPENFEMRGFSIMHATDITDQEMLSGMRLDLLQKSALTAPDAFNELERKVRSYLKRPTMRLGVAAYSAGLDNTLRLSRQLGRSLALTEQCLATSRALEESLYARVARTGHIELIDDLQQLEKPGMLEERFLAIGLRNVVVAPLLHDGELVGMLELGSPDAYSFNRVNLIKIGELLPLFAVALDRSTEELNNRVEALIKEEYTSIHPTVEWRFRSAAIKLLEERRSDATVQMRDLVFNDVYPLYGLSDVRDATGLRNAAIQCDLLEQLDLAQQVIGAALEIDAMPILREIRYKIREHEAHIRCGVVSGDESGIVNFLRSDVESVFGRLRNFGAPVTAAIDAYTAAVDADAGMVYRRRREFDQSLQRLNDEISTILDQEQDRAQAMFPHYFEKYKSDGIEHVMYVGASLVERRGFDRMYLRNLRLWQLLLLCRVAQRTRELAGELAVPMQTSHLLLVHDEPLAVRFRLDDKKFDVDGAYNLRYEIIKKRIDKVKIRGTAERLTQPGAIAVVFSQPKAAVEYREYFEFLTAAGFLEAGVEALELDPVQGIQGMQALRVTVGSAKGGVNGAGASNGATGLSAEATQQIAAIFDNTAHAVAGQTK